MLTQQYLKEALHYNPETGIFTWRERPSSHFKNSKSNPFNARFVGKISGNISSTTGYNQILIKYKHYSAHRLAWLYIYGYMPKGQIDHINHIRADNRIINLRDIHHKEQTKNMSLYKTNNTGIAGVSWDKERKKFKVNINNNKNLGRYKSLLDACCARKSAELKYEYHANHGNL